MQWMGKLVSHVRSSTKLWFVQKTEEVMALISKNDETFDAYGENSTSDEENLLFQGACHKI